MKYLLISLCPSTADTQKNSTCSDSISIKGSVRIKSSIKYSATPLKCKIFSGSWKIATAYGVKSKGQSKFSELRWTYFAHYIFMSGCLNHSSANWSINQEYISKAWWWHGPVLTLPCKTVRKFNCFSDFFRSYMSKLNINTTNMESAFSCRWPKRFQCIF